VRHDPRLVNQRCAAKIAAVFVQSNLVKNFEIENIELFIADVVSFHKGTMIEVVSFSFKGSFTCKVLVFLFHLETIHDAMVLEKKFP
jgi:hypothetical protein